MARRVAYLKRVVTVQPSSVTILAPKVAVGLMAASLLRRWESLGAAVAFVLVVVARTFMLKAGEVGIEVFVAAVAFPRRNQVAGSLAVGVAGAPAGVEGLVAVAA